MRVSVDGWLVRSVGGAAVRRSLSNHLPRAVVPLTVRTVRNLAHGILMALGFVALFVGSYFAATAIQEWWQAYVPSSTDLLRASGVITASLILGIGSQIRAKEDKGDTLPKRSWE